MASVIPFSRCLLFAVSTICFAAQSASAQQSPVEPALHRTSLENGLEVIVVENHAVPLATVVIAVRGGALMQQRGEEGLGHLLEHVLFRAYQGDPTAFAREAGRIHAAYNGATHQEVTTYSLMLPSDKVKQAIRLQARLVMRPRFEQDNLESEWPIVINELKRDLSDPERELARELDRRLWGDLWYRKDVSGDSVSLRRITAERLKEVFDRYYVPNNAALVVTGDVTARDVFKAARDHFRKWRPGRDPLARNATIPIFPLTATSGIVLSREVLDITVIVKFRGPARSADRDAALDADALLDLMNHSYSGFQQRLVGSGLFQSLIASYDGSHNTGSLSIHGRTTAEQAVAALARLLRELNQLDTLLTVDQSSLGNVAKWRETQTALLLEQTATLAPLLAAWWGNARLEYYDSSLQRANDRTQYEVLNFARRYVVNQPKVIGVVADPSVVAMIRGWLRQNTQPDSL